MKLNKLTLDSFRGATQPVTIHFDPSKPITMIFGENGNGKSTITDALTCLLTDKKGSIDDKSETDPKYLKSIGKNEAKITMETDKGTFAASISGTGRNVVKNPTSGQPVLKVLRRKMIVNLIESEASKRYDELKDFIDVSEIFKCEGELRKAKTSADSELERTVAVIATAKDTLEKAWKEEGEPGGEYMAWAELQAGMDVSELQSEVEKYKDLKLKWSEIDSKYTSYTSSKEQFALAEAEVNRKAEEFKQAQQQEKNEEAINLLELLEKAKSHIEHQADIDVCPVCSKDMEKEAVLSGLTTRIAVMSHLKKVSEAYRGAKRNFDGKKSFLDKDAEALNQVLKTYKDLTEEFLLSESWVSDFINGFGEDINHNISLFEERKVGLDDFHSGINCIEETKSKELNQHNLIAAQLQSITENTAKGKKLEQLTQVLSETLVIVESSRKDFIDTELQSISGEVDRLYKVIHPDEEIGKVKLFLKPNTQKSLVLGGKFHTENEVAPQSLYSESHLDTLGVCIFIALAQKYGDENTVLVLDDVVMSVDHNHLDRFITMISDEAIKFSKVILTTHYEPFRERYKRHRAPNLAVQFLELRPWSLETGIRLYNGRVELQEFETALNNDEVFDRQAIASKSGVLLENLLDFLSDIYEYTLPKRRNLKYTLGEYLDALKKDYLKDLRVVSVIKKQNAEKGYEEIEQETALCDIVNQIKGLAFIRNQVGAHFNLDVGVSDSEVEKFGRKTLKFAKLLICPSTGELPLSRELDHWKSKGGAIKLYPRAKK